MNIPLPPHENSAAAGRGGEGGSHIKRSCWVKHLAAAGPPPPPSLDAPWDAQMAEMNAPRQAMHAMRQPTPALENMARESSTHLEKAWSSPSKVSLMISTTTLK